jgi:hypothetical protein
MKLDTKTGATAVLVVMAIVYGIMLLKGIKPPAGFAATVFVTKDSEAVKGQPK